MKSRETRDHPPHWEDGINVFFRSVVPLINDRVLTMFTATYHVPLSTFFSLERIFSPELLVLARPKNMTNDSTPQLRNEKHGQDKRLSSTAKKRETHHSRGHTSIFCSIRKTFPSSETTSLFLTKTLLFRITAFSCRSITTFVLSPLSCNRDNACNAETTSTILVARSLSLIVRVSQWTMKEICWCCRLD
jgi:hypothetical protein